MQHFMSTNASRKQKKKKKVLQTSGSGYPLSCSKKFASFYEASVYSERMQKSKIRGLWKKILRMTSSLHKNKKSRKTVKITRPKITFVPLVNANLAKPNKIPVFAPETEVPHSHKSIEKVDVTSSSKLNNSLLPMSSSALSLGLDHQVSATELARSVFDQDDSVYPDLEHIVEWIGDGKPFSNMILTAYMDLYDFSNEKLEMSFRMLCLKLHLKGETQQIDRVLSRFATRYYQCNLKCIFGTADIVHAIVYSILLLNTDLHVAKGDYKRMSRSAFVKNTMDAIQVQIDPPADQSDRPVGDGYSFQSLEWIPLQRSSSNQSTYSSRSSTYSASIDFSRLHSSTPVTAASFGTRVWYNEMKGILKQMYSNIKSHQIATPACTLIESNSNHGGGRVSAVFKRSIGNIMFKGTQDLVLSSNQVNKTSPIPISPVSTVSTQQPRGSFSRRASISSAHSSISSSFAHYQTLGTHLQNTELPTVYISNSPYYKEGMVVRKHLLERTNQKAKHRDWKDCFMVIDRSQLRMYKLNGYNKRHRIRNSLIMNRLSDAASQISESSSSESIYVGGGDWMSHAQMMGSIDLRHTLANMLPSGYSPQRQHVFALQQSNGAVHLFQSGSAEQVQEWVSTCNYWAARESKEPLTGGVSSMEYGWGSCLTGGVHDLHEWQPPAVPTISSMLEEASQLEALMKHAKSLGAELDRHRELKSIMECHFYGHKSAAKAMSNWEKKSHYLLHEVIKYQNYCDSIEKSLQFQSNVMSY